MKTAIASLAVVLMTALSTTPFGLAQETDKGRLARSIVNEFQVQSRGQRRVVVREFRLPGSVDNEMTQAVKDQLQTVGVTPTLVADYEIEGRFRTKNSYGGQSHVLEIRIVNPNGYDHIREYSVPSQWLNSNNGGGHTESEHDHDHSHETDHHEEGGNSVGHQIYPNQEWKVYHLPQKVLSHCSNGFIMDNDSWKNFWAASESPTELPYVDFDTQMVRVETVPYPRTINAEIFSAGNGKLNVTKNVSNEPASEGDWLNAHVLILSKSDMGTKRKVRLGVTVDATVEGRGVIITSVVDGAPVTRGKMGDGRIVALEAGDVVLSLNGIRTDSIGMFADIIKNSDGSLRAEVLNVQNGETIYVTFSLD